SSVRPYECTMACLRSHFRKTNGIYANCSDEIAGALSSSKVAIILMAVRREAFDWGPLSTTKRMRKKDIRKGDHSPYLSTISLVAKSFYTNHRVLKGLQILKKIINMKAEAIKLVTVVLAAAFTRSWIEDTRQRQREGRSEKKRNCCRKMQKIGFNRGVMDDRYILTNTPNFLKLVLRPNLTGLNRGYPKRVKGSA
ncbi:unnamed protein product, partial [Sphenostylis stenocarpa]